MPLKVKHPGCARRYLYCNQNCRDILLRKVAFIATFLLLGGIAVFAQQSSNEKMRMVPARGTVVLDSMRVIPHSIRVEGLSPDYYYFDETTNAIFFRQGTGMDSVLVQYRFYPFATQPAYQKYRFDSVLNRFRKDRQSTVQSPMDDRLFNFGNLTASGSFGRSLSFGNAQDAVLNSQFNLQINGYLADSIQVAAAITDNNLPIQPDGTTQYLNEFDNVWIRFSKHNWNLNLGDIDVRKQPTHFLNYFKRQQGIAFEFAHPVGASNAANHFISAAISKGKFTRNIFLGIEGSQGPYRLSAPNGELYFMVLAGTERVFVDGVLMERGEDRDYVINYNTAEVRFTPRMMITRDKRIQIEFEYADRNYLNALLYAGEEWQIGKKLNIRVGAYNNSDAKNSPINQVLTGAQQDFLSGIGNDIENAMYPSVFKVPFTAERVLYTQADTLVDGQAFTIYRQTDSPSDSALSVAFTRLGPGLGNYRLALNASNGNAYEWVFPANGIPQGDYEPVVRLATPKSQQMLSAAVDFALLPTTNLLLEGAASRYDLNTFSKLGNDENGIGLKATLMDQRRLFRLNAKPFHLNSRVFFENLNEGFRPLERLRGVEFLRDWGLPFETQQSAEQLSGARFELLDSTDHQFLGELENYRRGDGYNGLRSQLRYGYTGHHWNLLLDGKTTNYTGADYSGYFHRPTLSAAKLFGNNRQFEAGGSWAVEENALQTGPVDTLQYSSFAFRDLKAWFKWMPQTDKSISFDWFQRKNRHPLPQGFIPEDISNHYTLRMNLLSGKVQQLRVHAGYRTLRILTPGITNQQDDRTFLGRFEYTVNLWRGLILGKLLYETGAGQEQQRNFTYVEVPAGRGEYTWIDYNSDGLQQLNEFEIAQFTDQANYVRILVATNIYVKSAYQLINYNILYTAPASWRNDARGIKKFASKWIAQSTLQSNNQAMAGERIFINPFAADPSDSNFVSQLFQWSNNLAYNRMSPVWGLDFTQIKSLNKALLMYGFESRLLNTYTMKGRWNLSRKWMLQATASRMNEELVTPGNKFQNRNYAIRGNSIAPSMVFTNGTRFRFQTSLGYDHKSGTAEGKPQTMHDLYALVETKYNILQKGIFTGKFSWHAIDFEGSENSTVSYAMLKGLEKGSNMLWNLEFTRRILRNVEMTFQYEGRKPGSLRTIHTGRAALRAVL